MEGLGLKWYSWMNLQEDKAATMVILNLVAMLMFVVLPLVWFMCVGWAGFHLNRTMDTFNNATNPIESGSSNVTKIGASLAKRGAGKLLK